MTAMDTQVPLFGLGRTSTYRPVNEGAKTQQSWSEIVALVRYLPGWTGMDLYPLVRAA